jgi:hypothetical protein
VPPDKRFTGDELVDAEMNREIARLRHERRGAASQSAKRNSKADDTSHGISNQRARKADKPASEKDDHLAGEHEQADNKTTR